MVPPEREHCCGKGQSGSSDMNRAESLALAENKYQRLGNARCGDKLAAPKILGCQHRATSPLHRDNELESRSFLGHQRQLTLPQNGRCRLGRANDPRRQPPLNLSPKCLQWLDNSEIHMHITITALLHILRFQMYSKILKSGNLETFRTHVKVSR